VLHGYTAEMSPALEIGVRTATVNDAPVIVSHRRNMFRDMGYRDEGALDSMAMKFLAWLQAKMRSREYLTWLAVTSDNSVIAGAGLWLMDWPPHMIGTSSKRGNILNVYTEPEFRHRGLARLLTQAALEWCRSNGIDCVILHASAEGRALYESLGFQPTNEMRIRL